MTIQVIDDIIVLLDEIGNVPAGPDKTKGWSAIIGVHCSHNEVDRTLYFVSNDTGLEKEDVYNIISLNPQHNIVVKSLEYIV